MIDHLKQYRIHSSWRNHVLKLIALRKAASRRSSSTANKGSWTTLEYCSGDAEYAKTLDVWLEFMEEEERYAFYQYFATASIGDAQRSLSLLMARKDNDPDIRMPLLRDMFTSYSRPFKHSHGRLIKKYRLTDAICIPEPKEVHKKILSDRDQLYAHCDLAVKEPRVSKLGGISLRGVDYYWSDYERLLPSMAVLFDNAMYLIREYTRKENMHDPVIFFQRFEGAKGLTANEPDLLNRIHGSITR